MFVSCIEDKQKRNGYKNMILLYYTIIIDEKDYWANVKMHKHYGEVLYTIKNEKPGDLIKRHKKSDIENVYSSAYGWRD